MRGKRVLSLLMAGMLLAGCGTVSQKEEELKRDLADDLDADFAKKDFLSSTIWHVLFQMGLPSLS